MGNLKGTRNWTKFLKGNVVCNLRISPLLTFLLLTSLPLLYESKGFFLDLSNDLQIIIHVYHLNEKTLEVSFRSLGLSGTPGNTAQRLVGAGIVLSYTGLYDIAECAMDRSRRSTGIPVPEDCILIPWYTGYLMVPGNSRILRSR